MSFNVRIPSVVPVLTLSDGVIFPGTTVRIPIRSKINIDMVEEWLLEKLSLRGAIVGVVFKKDNSSKGGSISHGNTVGIAGLVSQIFSTNWPTQSYTLTITGLCRIGFGDVLKTSPFVLVKIEQLDKYPSPEKLREKVETHEISTLKEKAAILLEAMKSQSAVRLKALITSSPVDHAVDLCASILDISYEEKLKVINAVDLKERITLVHRLLNEQLQILKKSNEDETSVVTVIPESVRLPSQGLTRALLDKFFGFENTPAIGDPALNPKEKKTSADEVLKTKLVNAGMPGDVEKMVLMEFEKLKSTPSFSPEYSSLRNYLELMAELPWAKETSDQLTLSKAKCVLDKEHYGLMEIKKRILQYLAVCSLRMSFKGPIICFVGPPGVGKTSIAKSIADSLGKKFYRMSLGGIADQSDIRGHRRTYVASMPGRIIQALKNVQSRNPVLLLDEVDKLSAGVHGNPAAALLEALDPEQNHTFVDHYVNAPFDLSRVLFIATANSTATIPAPLLDRMDVIHVPGYTQEEKFHICRNHLTPKQLKECGLTTEHVKFTDPAVKMIISKYTKEAGVRNLERKIAAVLRAVAVKVAEAQEKFSEQDGDAVLKNVNGKLPSLPFLIDEHALEDILGVPLYSHEVADSSVSLQTGVAAGLAWTPFGGQVLWIEASKWNGNGSLTLTGQLGDVMKESATLALNWLRANCHKLELSVDQVDSSNVHIHFPAGAVGKDGPSAGVTVLVALISLFKNVPVRSDTAMTGELTLRGLVLPVGGIKEKALAANQAGFKRVILPKKNEKDLLEVPEDIKKSLQFITVETLDDVILEAFYTPSNQNSVVGESKSKL